MLSSWTHSNFPMPLDATLHRPPEEDPLRVATRRGSRCLLLGFPERGRRSVFLGELRREVLRPCHRRRRTAVGLVIEPNRLPLAEDCGAGPYVGHYLEDGAADEGDLLGLVRRGRRIGDPAKGGFPLNRGHVGDWIMSGPVGRGVPSEDIQVSGSRWMRLRSVISNSPRALGRRSRAMSATWLS